MERLPLLSALRHFKRLRNLWGLSARHRTMRYRFSESHFVNLGQDNSCLEELQFVLNPFKQYSWQLLLHRGVIYIVTLTRRAIWTLLPSFLKMIETVLWEHKFDSTCKRDVLIGFHGKRMHPLLDEISGDTFPLVWHLANEHVDATSESGVSWGLTGIIVTIYSIIEEYWRVDENELNFVLTECCWN